MNSTVGVQDRSSAETHFSSYPNPFTSGTTFSFSSSDVAAVLEIVNVQGQMVHAEKIPPGTTSVSWDAKGLPEGLYFAGLRDGRGELVTIKLLKQ